MQVYIIATITALMPFIIAAAFHLYNMLVAHLPKSVQTFVTSTVHTAVLASEQSGASSVMKKQQAEDAVHTILNSLGYKVDPIYVDTAIEAAVLALHTSSVVIPPIVVAPVVVPPVGVPVVEVVKTPVVPTPITTIE